MLTETPNFGMESIINDYFDVEHVFHDLTNLCVIIVGLSALLGSPILRCSLILSYEPGGDVIVIN